LGELAQLSERVSDVEQEAQAIGPDGAVLGHDEDVFEEAVEGRADLRRGLDGGVEVARLERALELRVQSLDRLCDLELGRFDEKR
jgi:hypothetical protein